MRWLFLFFVVLACLTCWADDGLRTNTLSLNGTWEYAVGSGAEGAEMPAGQAGLTWTAAQVPGRFLDWNAKDVQKTRYLWLRRAFTATPAQAEALAALHWNGITYGAVAFINGRQVAEHATIGPYQVLLPAGALKAGENSIVLKIAGPAAVIRSKAGALLIPAGYNSHSGSDLPSVNDDVWLDFARDAYLKWVLAMPDPARSAVRFRVTPVGLTAEDGLTVSVEVREAPNGKVIGRGTAPAGAALDTDPLRGAYYFVDVPLRAFKPWTPETPNLCLARVTLSRGKQVLDEITTRFGMRQVAVKNGHYQMNGSDLWLRGSELMGDWNWAPNVKGHEVDYLVTEAREMNMNAFRTHTSPPPNSWVNICDEHGTMLLAEFPALYNGEDFQFTPDEYQIYHKNALEDAAGWMAHLWNHPSIVQWVLSNESIFDNAWEMGPYDEFAHQFDLTRPTMRTGQTGPEFGTRDNTDWHPCLALSMGEEGVTFEELQRWVAGRDGRTLSCTEYMNMYDSVSKRGWTGVRDPLTNYIAWSQFGMEFTEALRRARFDVTTPFMYAGWTKTRTGKEWKGGFAGPMSAVWHSALSPVLASLDLFDPDYRSGQQVTTDLCLINDTQHDAKIHVDLLITKENPEFIPEAACFDAPVAKWSFDFTAPADAEWKTPITWKLPTEPGSYWLTARTTGMPGRAVLSQRFIRAVRTPGPSAALKARTVVLLGGDAQATAFFTDHGMKVTNSTDNLKPAEQVVVIWDADKVTDADKQRAGALCDFAAAGGRVIVLAATKWTWKALCNIFTDVSRDSRAWPYEGGQLPAGITRDMLARWNGMPGTVVAGILHAPDGSNFVNGTPWFWTYSTAWPPVVDANAATGTGVVRFALLQFREHIDQGKPIYDPVAEHVLWRLLE